MTSPPYRDPPDRATKWDHVARLMADWYGDAPAAGRGEVQVADAEARLGQRFPAALRELHQRFGNRADAWNVQDTLLPPTEVYVESDHLVIASENQGVFRWAIPLASQREPDPAVVIFAPGSENHLEAAAPSITEFAEWWLLVNAKFSSRPLYRANGQVEDQVIDAIEKCVPRLPVPDIGWHVSPMRLYGNAELIVEVHDFAWLWVTARHPSSFERVLRASEAAGMTWESLERPP